MSAASESPEPAEADEQTKRRIPRSVLIAVGLVVLVVLIIGGYAGHWAWTGFSDNDTLWAWLKLLLLPIILASVPLWLRYGEFMDKRIRWLLLGVLVAFGALILVGYLVPWKWTGFTGNTLWDWLGLIMLPIAVSTIRVWPELRDRADAGHILGAAALISALIGLVLVGYLRPWEWTGFTGNTLWDWIQLLAVPLLLPTVIMPAALDFIKTGVDERKEEAQAEDEAAGDGEPAAGAAAAKGTEGDTAAKAKDAEPAEAPAPAETKHRRIGLASAGAAAGVMLLIGGAVGALAFGSSNNTSSSPSPQASTNPCTQASAATLTATPDGRVVQVGQSYYACVGSSAPIALPAAAGATSPPANFAVSQSRVAFTAEHCDASHANCTTQLMIVRVPDGHMSNPQTFDGGVAQVALGPNGGAAVMLRDPSKLALLDQSGTHYVADSSSGLDPNSLAVAGSTVYWQANGQPSSQQLNG